MTTADERFEAGLRVQAALGLDEKPTVRHIGVHVLYAPLDNDVLARQERDGYALLRVVPTFGQEAVAVFERVDRETDEDGSTTSISDVLHELTDLIERMGPDEVSDEQRQWVQQLIGDMRQAWPYAALVRRRLDSTGEPADAPKGHPFDASCPCGGCNGF